MPLGIIITELCYFTQRRENSLTSIHVRLGCSLVLGDPEQCSYYHQSMPPQTIMQPRPNTHIAERKKTFSHDITPWALAEVREYNNVSLSVLVLFTVDTDPRVIPCWEFLEHNNHQDTMPKISLMLVEKKKITICSDPPPKKLLPTEP